MQWGGCSAWSDRHRVEVPGLVSARFILPLEGREVEIDTASRTYGLWGQRALPLPVGNPFVGGAPVSRLSLSSCFWIFACPRLLSAHPVILAKLYKGMNIFTFPEINIVTDLRLFFLCCVLRKKFWKNFLLVGCGCL